MKPELVIFDNDGVLIDSEVVWHQINAQEMAKLGISLTLEKSIELFTFVAKRDFDEILQHEFGRTITELEKLKINQITERSYKTKLKPIKDISCVLSYLKEKGVKICVASNGDNSYILETLAITNLDKYFNSTELFGASSEDRRKPAPDLFLEAAHYFGINHENCLVIEDHPLGIQAAKAAGMPAYGFLGASHMHHYRHKESLANAGAATVLESANELLNTLKLIYD